MNIKEMLESKGIPIKREVGQELLVDCLVGTCDSDSRENEAHLYINSETGAFQCKKCGASGGYLELEKILGIEVNDKKNRQTSPHDYWKHEDKLSKEHIDYLVNERGINLATIKSHHIGYLQVARGQWYSIPYFNELGEYTNMYKLRATDKLQKPKYIVYPPSSKTTLYGLDKINKSDNTIVLCEGEFDAILLHQEGLNAITSGAGAQTFKDEWLPYLKPFKKIYLWYDNDPAGREGQKSRINSIPFFHPEARIFEVMFPDQFEGKDITDLKKAGFDIKKLIQEAKEIPTPALPREEYSLAKLEAVLDETIKEDNANKVITFLGLLSMYSQSSQFNIMYNAPSSTGKSYIPLEIAKLFPKDDLQILSYATPTSFFHLADEFNIQTNTYTYSLAGKTIIFKDQPNSLLLEKLRPILSHDNDEAILHITDKQLKGGMKTKTVILKGFPAVVFCTTNTTIDEQEITRVLLLSPEDTQEKIKSGIHNRILAESNRGLYDKRIEGSADRLELIQRINAIKYSQVKNVVIPDPEKIFDRYIADQNSLRPRHLRDAGRLIHIITSLTLLNLWTRKRINENTIEANEIDIENGFKLWKAVEYAQSIGIAPYILEFLDTVLFTEYETCSKQPDRTSENEVTIDRKGLVRRYKSVNNYIIDLRSLEKKYLDPLVNAGILEAIKSFSDGRTKDYVLTDYGLNIYTQRVGILSEDKASLQTNFTEVI